MFYVIYLFLPSLVSFVSEYLPYNGLLLAYNEVPMTCCEENDAIPIYRVVTITYFLGLSKYSHTIPIGGISAVLVLFVL